jgi:8-oxo-dGTP diphosphatase
MSPKKKPYCYEYPRPAVTVDVVIVTRERTPRVLLIRRKHDPFEGMWAIPGGFVDMDEPLDAAARRELREETGVEVAELEQLHTFGDPGRDPRGRVIAVAYLARVKAGDVNPAAADDAAAVGWHRLDRLPPLAFDHDQILACARRRLRAGRPRAGQKRGA